MTPVDHGYVCYFHSKPYHKSPSTSFAGWGATRASAIANASYPSVLYRRGWVQTCGASEVPSWMWPFVRTSLPWGEVGRYLRELPEELRRVGRFHYDLEGTWDIVAHLATTMRRRGGWVNESSFYELPERLRTQLLKDVSEYGLLEEHVVRLQEIGETIEGTAEERWTRFVGVCEEKERQREQRLPPPARRRASPHGDAATSDHPRGAPVGALFLHGDSAAMG